MDGHLYPCTRLCGRVVNERHCGISHVKVQLLDCQNRVVGFVYADEYGYYQTRIPLCCVCRVRYLKNGYDVKTVSLCFAKRACSILLHHSTFNFVYGNILSDGKPPQICRVRLFNPYFTLETNSDSLGRYFFKNVPNGIYDLTIENPAYFPYQSEIQIQCGQSIIQIPTANLDPKATGSVIGGFILYQDLPVKFIDVVLMNYHTNECIAYTQTDEFGHYTFSEVQAGTYYIMGVG